MLTTKRYVTVSVCVAIVLAASLLPWAAHAESFEAEISVDSRAITGVVQPTVTGQMAEWASDGMNGVWAEKITDRSMEHDVFTDGASSLYDAFDAEFLDASKWSMVSLDNSPEGELVFRDSTLRLSSARPGRWGLMSRTFPQSNGNGIAVETMVTEISGMNAILNLYAGTGAGDFSKYVELAIEHGKLKVFGDGVTPWVGTEIDLPAALRIEASVLFDGRRDIRFLVNGNEVHSLRGVPTLDGPLRAFIYGYDGTIGVDWITVSHDNAFDHFEGQQLSNRWDPLLLEGTTEGHVVVRDGRVRVKGGKDSRFVLMSRPIVGSAVDWTTLSARAESYQGRNALVSIYGGQGAGDFSSFLEFGVEDGIARVFAPGGYSWTGRQVDLPAVLTVQVSPYYANGRSFRFYVDGNLVHQLFDQTHVPAGDFRVGLYGYSDSETVWDWITLDKIHMWDQFAPHFEGGPGLSVEWTPVSLEGGWGRAIQQDSQLRLEGARNSRYGVLSQRLEESDLDAYGIEAKIDEISGRNALINVYAGQGRGDFSHFVEYGIEDGNLKVFGEGIPTWVGPKAMLPATLKVEVSAWTGTGRDYTFFYNGRLVHRIENLAVIGATEYQVFVYGYGETRTAWDYVTWWKLPSWKSAAWDAEGTVEHVHGAYNGHYSSRVNVLRASANGFVGAVQGAIDLVAGHSYQVSWWAKGSGVPVTFLVADSSQQLATQQEVARVVSFPTGDNWQKFSATLVPSRSVNNGIVAIGTSEVGTFDFDMLSLMPQDPTEAIAGGWRPEFVNALRELNPGLIRWPGGIIADSYYWQHGIGPRDARAPMYFAQWNAQWMTNDVGTHEILDLAEELDLEVILNVNWGQGTAEDAASWVEYVTKEESTAQGRIRSANGRKDPWDVNFWEIGNEVWGWWTPGHTDSQTYANSYVQFAELMKRVNPNISLIGEGGDGNNVDQTWNEQMLSTAGEHVDHLAVHYYSPQPLPQNYESSAVFMASVAAPRIIEQRMDATAKTARSAGNKDTKLAVLEHAAMYFNEEHRRTRTLEGGLVEAGIFNLLIRRPDINEINAASALVNFWDGSSFRVGRRGVLKTPSFYVQSNIAEHTGELVVNAKVVTPTYDTNAVGNLPAQKNVPYLDVTATRSAQGDKLYLSVVNRHPSDAIVTKLEFANATVNQRGTAHVVSASHYLLQNKWNEMDAIAPIQHEFSIGTPSSYTFLPHSHTILEIPMQTDTIELPFVVGKVQLAGNTVANAVVNLGGIRQTTTDSSGYFYFENIPPGTYEYTVALPNGQNQGRSNFEVHNRGGTTQIIEFP